MRTIAVVTIAAVLGLLSACGPTRGSEPIGSLLNQFNSVHEQNYAGNTF